MAACPAPLSFPFQLLNFGIAWAGSWKIGAQFPTWLYLPMIVGYMTVGFASGPHVTGMLSPSDTVNTQNPFSIATVISNTTLAFIAFSAGAELRIPSLGRRQMREIMAQILFMAFFMLVVGTPIIFISEGLMPSTLFEAEPACRWAAAWLLAVVQLAGSVIEVLAIKHETRGKGPVTQLMISVTMILDMMVLVMFAVSQNIVIAACPMPGVSISLVKSTLSVFGSVMLWIVCGVLLGLVLQLYLAMPGVDVLGLHGNLIKPALIVVTGGLSFYGLLALNKFLATLGGDFDLLRVDPLLVCMIAAIWASQLSESCGSTPEKGDGLGDILEDMAHLIMPPFFTIAGATLDVEAIVANWKAPPVLFTIRFVSLAVGSYAASSALRQRETTKKHLWMTLQSQSGVTLGLVAQMQMGLMGEQEWAKGTAAIITGCVVINQLVGPTLCRHGIRSAGESRAEEDELPDPGVDLDLRPALERQTSTVSRRRVSSRFKSDGSSLGEEAKARRARTASALTTMDGPEVSRTRNAMSTRIPEDVWEEEGASPSKFDDKQTGQYLCCDYVDGQEHEPEGML